jgi:hypothetical protein
MKRDPAKARRANSETELLILPDGRVLVHNLTAMVAEALVDLNPQDRFINRRVFAGRKGHSRKRARRSSP